MTSWLERYAWRKEFKGLGDLYVKRMVMASNYSGDKLAYARHWLDQEHHFYTRIALLIVAAGVLGIISAIAALMD